MADPHPFSIRGLAQSASNAVGAVTKTFSKPEGYVSAKSEQAAAAPPPPAAPAPAPAPQLGGVNMDATRRREAAAGLKNGGRVPGKRNGNKDTVPIMATPGEVVLPVDTVDAHGGAARIKREMIDPTHTPIRKMAKGKYADGGVVDPAMADPASAVPAPAASGAPGYEQDLAQRNAGALSTIRSSSSMSNSTMAPRTGAEQKSRLVPDPAAAAQDLPDAPPRTINLGQRSLDEAQRMANGGMVKGYANGGEVEDPRNPHYPVVETRIPPPAAAPASQPRLPPLPQRPWDNAEDPTPIRPASAAPTAPGALPFRNIRAVLRGASDDVMSLAGRGEYGRAAGQAVAGGLAAIPALNADVNPIGALAGNNPGGGVAAGARNFISGLFGGADPGARAPAAAAPTPVNQPAPAATAATSTMGAPYAGDARLYRGPEPSNIPAGPVSTSVAPGITKVVGADGRVTYTNMGGEVAPPAAAPAAGVSPVRDIYNRAAADYRDMAHVGVNTLPAGAGLSVMPDNQAVRNAQFDAKTVRDQGARRGGRTGAALVAASGGMTAAAPNAAYPDAVRTIMATQDAAAREIPTTERVRETVAGRLAETESRSRAEAPLRAAQTNEANTRAGLEGARSKGVIQQLAAQEAYGRALAGGNQKAILEAQDALRAAQGKWEKEAPELYSTTALPSVVGPTGERIPGGAIVTNKRTGETRIIKADEVGAGPAAQKTTPREEYDKMPAGGRYFRDGVEYVKR